VDYGSAKLKNHDFYFMALSVKFSANRRSNDEMDA
jgi:hypothetical protein